MEQTQELDQLEITSEEFQAWATNRITKDVVKQIVGSRDYLKEFLASGNTLSGEGESTDRIVGRIEGMTYLFTLFSEVKETAEEASQYEH